MAQALSDGDFKAKLYKDEQEKNPWVPRCSKEAHSWLLTPEVPRRASSGSKPELRPAGRKKCRQADTAHRSFPKITFNKNGSPKLLPPCFLSSSGCTLYVAFGVASHSKSCWFHFLKHFWSLYIFTFICYKKLMLHAPFYPAILLLSIFPYLGKLLSMHSRCIYRDTHRSTDFAGKEEGIL